ncbi:MAG: DUF134 domain-containing protein [Desulfovibrionales bacterium]
MPRPKKCRMVHSRPKAVFYKPQGVPLHNLKGVVLPLEGFEALRLADEQGLSQEEAAGRMGVSRPTLCRILAEARKTVATALVHGMAIRIEGGEFMIGAEPCTALKRCGQRAGRTSKDKE